MQEVTCSILGPHQNRIGLNAECQADHQGPNRQIWLRFEFNDAQTDERLRFEAYLTLHQAEELVDTITLARRSLVAQLLKP